MNAKFLLSFVLVIFLTFSCRNDRNTEGDEAIPASDAEFSPTPAEISRKDTVGRKETSSSSQNRQSADSDVIAATPSSLQGTYIKKGQENLRDCSCFCIEINFSENIELCLVPDEMYIIARLEQVAGNTINVYLTEDSPKNHQGEEIPWKDFDRTSPIATLTPLSNREIELDWLGFSFDGDLAMDYAIFGKNTLEGTYRKL